MAGRTYTVSAPVADLGAVIGEPDYGWQRVVVLVKECSADVQFVYASGGQVAWAAKSAGGDDALRGTFFWGELKGGSITGTSATLTFTLVDAGE